MRTPLSGAERYYRPKKRGGRRDAAAQASLAGRHGNSAVRSNVTIGQISRVTAARPSNTGSKVGRFEKMGHSRCQRRQRFMGNELVEMASSWQLKRKLLCSAAQYALHLPANLGTELGFKSNPLALPRFLPILSASPRAAAIDACVGSKGPSACCPEGVFGSHQGQFISR